MTIENLIKVIPPPTEPVSAFSGPWEPIEAEIGTRLPQDYKDLARLYGFGKFLNFLVVYSPICRSPYVRLGPQVHTAHALFRGVELPCPLWPGTGGLLVCGGTDFSDQLFWLTRGQRDEWPIVVWGRGLQQFESFECDLTDFIAGLVTGDVRPEDLPGDLDDLDGEELFTSRADLWPERD